MKLLLLMVEMDEGGCELVKTKEDVRWLRWKGETEKKVFQWSRTLLFSPSAGRFNSLHGRQDRPSRPPPAVTLPPEDQQRGGEGGGEGGDGKGG